MPFSQTNSLMSLKQSSLDAVQQRNRRMYERWLTGWTRDVLVCRALKKKSLAAKNNPADDTFLRDWADAKLSGLLGD